MHFIFGYEREIQMKIKRETPKAVLLGIAILVVLLFLFLTFENIDEENFSPSSSFNVASSSAKGGIKTYVMDKFDIETHMLLYELK